MHRFYVPTASGLATTIVFSKNQSHQIANVLRISAGSLVQVFDDRGNEYEVEITNVSSLAVSGRILNTSRLKKPEIDVTLFMSPLKHDHFELVLQKCTEIGIASIRPVITSRTITNYSNSSHKEERWKRIMIEAAEQSHSRCLPELYPPVKLEEAFHLAKTLDHCYLAWENERSRFLLDFLLESRDSQIYKVGIFIGPEGGFSEIEQSKAESQGILSVSLGSQVLRSETAAIVSCFLITNYSDYIRRLQK